MIRSGDDKAVVPLPSISGQVASSLSAISYATPAGLTTGSSPSCATEIFPVPPRSTTCHGRSRR